MLFELVSILFAIIPDYGNEYMRKEKKNWTSFKSFAPKLNLDHNMCNSFCFALIYKCYIDLTVGTHFIFSLFLNNDIIINLSKISKEQ